MTQAFHQTYPEVISAHKQGTLRDWVIQYLENEGNHGLLSALDRHPAQHIELIEVPLTLLKKIEGPEAPQDRETNVKWDNRVDNLEKKLEEGFIPPPLIATDFWRPLEIADGNHRHEALMKRGVQTYWTIFFLKDDTHKAMLSQYGK